MSTTQIYDPDDTICAICTPAGTGALAVIRISGQNAFHIADSIWKGRPLSNADSHTAHLGYIIDPDSGETLDQALATVFRAPATFTGDNVVEFSIHGSRWIQRQLIGLLLRKGCRMALPGEFTRRAFAAGKMDLSEAEAVADVIAASSAAAHRLAINQMRGDYSRRLNSLRDELIRLASLLELELDFSEEDVEFANRSELLNIAGKLHDELVQLTNSFSSGRAIKDGVPITILGPTNAGKSSLLNTLLGDDRAIVSDIHGTTRDIVEDTIEIGPYLIRFKDTAGLRDTSDSIETIGISRSINAANTSRIVLYIIDPTQPYPVLQQHYGEAETIYVINKIDIATPQQLQNARSSFPDAIEISASNGTNIDSLRTAILNTIANGTSTDSDTMIVTNARHAAAFREAADTIAAVIAGLENEQTPDLIAEDLRLTIHHLSSITGEITTPQILQSIFENFCIGK